MFFQSLLTVCFCLIACFNLTRFADGQDVEKVALPLIAPEVVFEENDGRVVVEAEHFFQQTADEKRRFYLVTKDRTPKIAPDGDPNHVGGASGGAYLEILPDTRRTHGDKLEKDVNFQPQPGKQAIVSYKVKINDPGRYYVWVRAYSTGSEDNGLHVGIDGTWPKTGQRLQWCAGKHTWRWESKQRTEKEHCGVPHKIYLDIEKPGLHTIHFSMREDGFEFDQWLMTKDRDLKRPNKPVTISSVASGDLPKPFAFVEAPKQPVVPTPIADPSHRQETKPAAFRPSPTKATSDLPQQKPRQEDGKGDVDVTGDLMVWHAVTFSFEGPFAHELDNQPNPFTDYDLRVTFRHQDGTTYQIPGFFAADGKAAESSAKSGTIWRAHFAPDRAGEWTYQVSMRQGDKVALYSDAKGQPVASLDGKSGSFVVLASNKVGKDMRAHGRLATSGKRYLRHLGSGKYFLKIGADAPETLLAYADFDDTIGTKKNAPLKHFRPHVGDWEQGDPTWQDGKGKGLIGAINYLAGKGCNAFSFLTYNAGGDGNNVWPFVNRDDKLHYDCSKLDQWSIVLAHGTKRGMYLHFKLQETEIDDHKSGHKNAKTGFVPTSLDGGELKDQRRLYLREIIARFGHNLALNWNLGEENTQSTRQLTEMMQFIEQHDAYRHPIVLHTFPDQQDKVYRPLMTKDSMLDGLSLQNSGIKATHWQTLKWVNASAAAGVPWVVAFDESGTAAHGQCPDLGYKGFDGKDTDGKMIYTEHEVRHQTLWGHLMAGGAGCEYYFGYKFAENDLQCEDWRSRDRSWDYGRIAIDFFHENQLPFWEMNNANALIGNKENKNHSYCFAKPNEVYVVYLSKGKASVELDLSDAVGEYQVSWFNPRSGEALITSDVQAVAGGGKVALGPPPQDQEEDWVVLVRKK